MKLRDFRTEQWMTDHEKRARFNLTDTCIEPLTLKELTDLDSGHRLDNLLLDYGDITGDMRLKEAIAALYPDTSAEQITRTAGCSQANELVMEELLNPGDHVIAFMPGYEQFVRLPESIGCTCSIVKLREEDGWQPQSRDLLAAWQLDTRMVLLNLPNNPTGSLFPQTFLDTLFRLAERDGTWILCDEAYRDQSVPSLCASYPKAIITASLSKVYSLAGLRSGWIRAPKEIIDRINRRRDYSIISTGPLSDCLSLIALENREVLQQRNEAVMRQARRAVQEWLAIEPRAHLVFPASGPVSFLGYEAPVHSRDLAEALLVQEGVFFVPGWCFDCEYHLRLAFTRSPGVLAEGLKRFSNYLDQVGKGQP
jgi:aspartate/methionine/tyrosine aminotransferase